MIIEDIVKIRTDLSIRGYSFVTLNEHFVNKVKACEKEMIGFFNLDNSFKESYFREPVFGYFNVPHKEVFRFATGDKLENYAHPSNAMKELSIELDSFMFDLASKIFPNIVKTNMVPFNFGLIDVVRYGNDTVRKNNLNIVEHYDAGLLAFNFLSTAPGLEFKNEHGEWIPVPVGNGLSAQGMGILWTGHAIKSYNDYPEGIHRVKVVDKPRLSMWYEICTQDQMRDDMLTDYKGYQYELDLMKKEGYDAIRNDDGNIIGFSNEMIGFKAMEANTTGSSKTAVGDRPLSMKDTGSFTDAKSLSNDKALFLAMEDITTGSNKVAIGSHSLELGGHNIAIGMNALSAPIGSTGKYDKYSHKKV